MLVVREALNAEHQGCVARAVMPRFVRRGTATTAVLFVLIFVRTGLREGAGRKAILPPVARGVTFDTLDLRG